MNSLTTLDYYNQNAQSFATGTVSVDFHETQDRFLKLLDKGILVLDFGCGSGRDTKYFLEHGIHVEAIDGSEELCRIASDYAGIPVNRCCSKSLRKQKSTMVYGRVHRFCIFRNRN